MLLVPDNDSLKSTESVVGLELLKQPQRDCCLDRVLAITQFYKALGIYKRVMCEAFPQQLDLHEADIGEIFDHYRDQARGRLGRKSRPRGQNFALKGNPGRSGSFPKKKKKKKFFFFFFFF